MAGEDLYNALSALQYSPMDNPYGQAAGTIASATPGLINPYGSTGQAIGIALGGTLISSLLGYQARQEAAQQSLESARLGTSLLGAITPQDRLGIIERTPDASMQSKLLGLNSQLLGQERLVEALRQQKLAEAPIEIDIKRAQELGVSLPELAQIDKERSARRAGLLAQTTSSATTAMPGGATDLLATPETYEYLTKPEREALKFKQDAEVKKTEQVDALRKEFSGLPEVKNYSLIDNAAKIVTKAVKDPSSVATQELVRRAVQLIEPGMAVREGEQTAIMASQSIPDRLKGELTRAFAGEGGLSEPTREGILRIAERAYTAQADRYKVTKDYYEGMAKERNLPSNKISYLGEAPSWEKITSSEPSSSKQSTLSSILQEMKGTTDPAKIAELKQRAADIYKAP
jgi:hypothetical protein